MISRRKLLIALGASALTVPLSSFSQQQGKIWRIGFLVLRARPDSLDSTYLGAFPRGMRELGYVEGKNLVIEWRFADGKIDRLPGLAAELAQLKVDVIVTAGSQATSAAQKANGTIPIVMGTVGDPVGSGFVKSLAHPGGNITGLSELAVDISSKLLEMLLSVVPKLSRVAVLINPTNSYHAAILSNTQAAAQIVGLKVLPVKAQTPQEIENAFSSMAKENVGAVIITIDSIFNQQQRQISELAVKHHLPSIVAIQQYVEAGCLMSYGASLAGNLLRAATYVDKIFKGAKPGDLPVEQPTKFELAINMKTAKALGIKIPNSILVRADRVIE